MKFPPLPDLGDEKPKLVPEADRDVDGGRGPDTVSDPHARIDVDPDSDQDSDEAADTETMEPPLLEEAMIVADPVGDLPVPAAIRKPRSRPAADDPIPMLTEVVQVPRYDVDDLPQSLAEVDWGDLGQRVRENVLERLLRRSDALLDAQLQTTLSPVLERAAETVVHELHDTLNRMIRDIVARAVTEELTRLHAEIARQNRQSRNH